MIYKHTKQMREPHQQLDQMVVNTLLVQVRGVCQV